MYIYRHTHTKRLHSALESSRFESVCTYCLYINSSSASHRYYLTKPTSIMKRQQRTKKRKTTPLFFDGGVTKSARFGPPIGATMCNSNTATKLLLLLLWGRSQLHSNPLSPSPPQIKSCVDRRPYYVPHPRCGRINKQERTGATATQQQMSPKTPGQAHLASV